MEKGGLDSAGREFKNAEEMWREQLGEDRSKKIEWYRQGVGYREGLEASTNGVLGGYAQVNEPDIMGNCGSGIGRVSKNLLIRYFNEVDLLEPVSHFLETARESLAPENHKVSDMHKATNFFCMPPQEFTPEAGRYNIIWVQWCIGHLTDDDFVSFFKRAKDQKGLPEELFAVKMYALTTELPKKVHWTRSEVQANRPGVIK
ncbi:hypothetical protein C1H46_027802 [Malus baccata]|uniref:Alpha N-terminal protein methyltransferase 1 n=1 Tax=Malus baccata TaxID=106549 RepID=A0A540LJM5_MALBA|nr:hypothetical protein C1H46_027802 [Malus baccata]